MAYTYTSDRKNAWPAKSLATPKTHTPFAQVEKRGLRFYHPGLGRWVSRDPIGDPASPIGRDVREDVILDLCQRAVSQLWNIFYDKGAPAYSQYDSLESGVTIELQKARLIALGDPRLALFLGGINQHVFCANDAMHYTDLLGAYISWRAYAGVMLDVIGGGLILKGAIGPGLLFVGGGAVLSLSDWQGTLEMLDAIIKWKDELKKTKYDTDLDDKDHDGFPDGIDRCPRKSNTP